MKTILTIKNLPVLDVSTLTVPENTPNYGKKYGLIRDRNSGRYWSGYWSELRSSDISLAKEVKLTKKLKLTLLEDLAYAYGRNADQFRKKIIEFNLIT